VSESKKFFVCIVVRGFVAEKLVESNNSLSWARTLLCRHGCHGVITSWCGKRDIPMELLAASRLPSVVELRGLTSENYGSLMTKCHLYCIPHRKVDRWA
jgi:hypothetical protein